MNNLSSRHKQCHFNFTTFPLYLVKLKNIGRPLTAVISVIEPIVPNFRRNWFSVPLVFSMFVRNFYSRLLTENISNSRGFYQKIIFKLNMVNFSM